MQFDSNILIWLCYFSTTASTEGMIQKGLHPSIVAQVEQIMDFSRELNSPVVNVCQSSWLREEFGHWFIITV